MEEEQEMLMEVGEEERQAQRPFSRREEREEAAVACSILALEEVRAAEVHLA